ncbi:MAG: hypothetical protein KKD44_25820 [Proteobacteria bacterium]|nr:hypothetical protein [Pseudomonadota bacterium]
MSKKLIGKHYWSFLHNYNTKAEAERGARGHKKTFGGFTTIKSVPVGHVGHKDYLLYWRP